MTPCLTPGGAFIYHRGWTLGRGCWWSSIGVWVSQPLNLAFPIALTPTPASITQQDWEYLPCPAFRVILKIKWDNRKHSPTCKASWDTSKGCMFCVDGAPFSPAWLPGLVLCLLLCTSPASLTPSSFPLIRELPPHRVNQKRLEEGKRLSLGDSGHRAFNGSFH